MGATRKSRNHTATVVIRSWDPSGIRADPAGSGDCQNEPPRIHPAKGQPVAATRIHASKPVRHPVRGIPFEGPRDPQKSTETRLLLHFVLSGEVHGNPRKSTENKCNSEDLSRYLGCRVSSRSATKIHGLGLGFRVRVEGLGFVGLGFRVTD